MTKLSRRKIIGLSLYLITFILICLIAKSFWPMGTFLSEHFKGDSRYAVSLLGVLGGPLPSSTITLLNSSCIRFYSDANFTGDVLGCIPVGQHSDPKKLDIIKKCKSIKIPSSFIFQIYGKDGDFWTGTNDIATWLPPTWTMWLFVIFDSELTGSKSPTNPAPVADDWKDTDGHVISSDNASSDLSNVPRFDIDQVFGRV